MFFETSYKQLEPAEKAFVDDYVSELERVSVRLGIRLDELLHQATPPNLSERAHDFLSRPIVRAAIAERVKEIVEQFELSAHRVIKELASIAFASIGDYMEVDELGQPHFDLTKCTPEQLAAVASIEVEESMRGTRKFKFKLHDKLSGLDKFMRYMGLLDPDNPHWAELSALAQKAKTPQLTADEDAAAAYSRAING